MEIFLTPDFSTTQIEPFALASFSIKAIRAFRLASCHSPPLFRSLSHASILWKGAEAVILAGKSFVKSGGTYGPPVTSIICADGISSSLISLERAMATRLDRNGWSGALLFWVLLERLAGADFFWHDFCFV